MCGISGIISSKSGFVRQNNLQKMANVLEHRGPDGEGFWVNENATIGFAHRRLAVIDLSADATQPFQYLHCTVIFNGEIYNYIELKETLKSKGFIFKTASDTEVIAAAYLFWGKDCLHQFDGMFAFALFDSKTNKVFIARDRFGEKPLYYHVSRENNDFYFASEMKALWAVGIEKEINNLQLLNYLTLGLTSNPTNKSETFYSNIKALEAGHYITITIYELRITNWKYKEQQTNQKNNSKLQTSNNTVETFSNLLSNSVNTRLRSDVAVGTSLSGGLDSSSIVANIHQLTQKGNYKPQTFTASFPNFKNDETQYSKKVADYFKLQQYFTTPTEFDFVNEFENLIFHQEEPLQSSSVFTQYMVYKLAKEKGITVLLDGQGADEILGGYKKYVHWYLQEILRTSLAKFKEEKALLKTNEFLETWSYKNYLAAFMPKFTVKQLQQKAINQQNINKFINTDFLRQYQNINSLEKPVIKELQDLLNYNTHQFGLQDLLRYADRNSMAHSREVRLPFLNHQLVEFTTSLPSSYKINNGFTKWILRESVKDKLPNEIVWRKGKVGYEPPQQQWMQNKQIQKMIVNAREKLVANNILNPSILTTNIEAKSAHEANNFDWYVLCAAQLM
ncbi:MAG: asparagine synthase (glutamine-hydrolyzing) [Chitinophagaceae bacterium]